MTRLASLADGNRLQRAYHRWAAPRYAGLPAGPREQAEAIDLFLYSRRGLGVWLGLAGAVVGSSLGLWRAGMSGVMALSLSLLLWAVLPFALLVAWVQPMLFSNPAMRRRIPFMLVLAALGGMAGFVVGDVAQRGSFDAARTLDRLLRSLDVVGPAVLLASLAMLALMWGAARVRRQILERELERVRLAQERDAAARQAAEARLKLLQGQIQPHFIFNTLAAAQHWVEAGDARAPALLRSLGGFLRGSTDLLMRDSALLADELALVRDYLAVMQARLGERLRFEIDADEALALRSLPPGLLLTLVENAVEHGAAPALAGATVRIDAHARPGGWTLAVRDDGAGLAMPWSEGVGLRNSRERLQHAFGSRATLSIRPRAAGGTDVRIEFEEETT